MILTVDIGNTNIKIGAWDHDRLAFVHRFQTNTLATADEYALKIINMFSLGDFNTRQFDGAIVSSVVPQLSRNICEAIKQVIHVNKVFQISPGLKTGLNIKIDNPATLGSDTVCFGVAAIEKYTLPCIIVSLGTASTVFAINKNAELLGGAILPGVVISMNALSQGTAQLPHISLTKPETVIGRNTVQSMNAGIVYGNAGMIDNLIELTKQELGTQKATIIATGGVADIIIPYCKNDIIINNDIVLEGLKMIYDKNVNMS